MHVSVVLLNQLRTPKVKQLDYHSMEMLQCVQQVLDDYNHLVLLVGQQILVVLVVLMLETMLDIEYLLDHLLTHTGHSMHRLNAWYGFEIELTISTCHVHYGQTEQNK